MSNEEVNPFNELGGEDSVDELLASLAQALEAQAHEEREMIHELVNTVVSREEADNPIVGNFVLVAEVISQEGEANLMVATSENLPEWIARGLLMMAEEYIATGL